MSIESQDFWAEEMFRYLGRLPAVELLQKAQNAAQAAGHQFYGSQSSEGPLVDLEGEVSELLEAIRCNHSTAHVRNEVGDVIFCLINVCRLHGVDFDNAVEKAAERWLTRKSMQEKKLQEAGCNWRTAPKELRERIWREVKTELKNEEYIK
jgi:uncharacterized protein YabN with tetrapyrrole methylase and pyrophosphatase domain